MSAPVETATATTPSAVWADRAERSIVGLFVLVMAGTAVLAFAQGWQPISDDALIELAVRDVPGNLPLTGVYSRFGWDHPGPSWFYLLAVPYRVLGSSSAALLVGSVCFQTAATVAAWWVARRLNRAAGLIVLVALLGVLASTPAWAIRSPWNPQVALIGAGLLLVLAWGTAMRARVATVALLPLATLLVQAHLVTAPIVVLTVAAAVLLALVPAVTAGPAGTDAADRAAEPFPRSSALLGLAITALMWLPPVIQQLTGDDGNLAAILQRQAEGDPAGLGDALGSLTHMFGLLPQVFQRPTVTSVFVPTTLVAPVWALLPIAAVVVAWRRRDRLHLVALGLSGAALVGCTLGIALTSGGVFDYLVVGSRSVVAVTLALSCSALVAATTLQRTDVVRLAACGVAAVLCVVIAVEQLTGENPRDGYGPTVERLTDAVLEGDLDGTLAVDSALDFRAAEVAPAVLLQLERAGREVTSTDGLADRIGAQRSERSPDHIVIVAPLEQREQLLDEGWTILGSHQPLPDDVVTRSNALRQERTALGTAPGDPDELFDQMMQIDEELARIEAGRVPMLVAARPA